MATAVVVASIATCCFSCSCRCYYKSCSWYLSSTCWCCCCYSTTFCSWCYCCCTSKSCYTWISGKYSYSESLLKTLDFIIISSYNIHPQRSSLTYSQSNTRQWPLPAEENPVLVRQIQPRMLLTSVHNCLLQNLAFYLIAELFSWLPFTGRCGLGSKW